MHGPKDNSIPNAPDPSRSFPYRVVRPGYFPVSFPVTETDRESFPAREPGRPISASFQPHRSSIGNSPADFRAVRRELRAPIRDTDDRSLADRINCPESSFVSRGRDGRRGKFVRLEDFSGIIPETRRISNKNRRKVDSARGDSRFNKNRGKLDVLRED